LINSKDKDIALFGKALWIALWAGAILVLFINNGLIRLWDQDEAAYAGFAHNMLKTGHWLVPDFMWSMPHRKTPLHFWLIAFFFRLFGENEFSTRLPSVVSVLLTCLVLARMGARLFGKEIARLAALLMLTTLLLPSIAKISVVDPVLMLAETIAILALFNYAISGKLLNLLWIVLSVGAGLLLKGPPVWIVFFGVAGLMFIKKEYRKRVFIAGLVSVLAAIPLLVWGILVWQSDHGQFIRWFMDWYIFQRVTGSVWGQTGYPGYYFIVFCISFLPWLPFLLPAFGSFFTNIIKNKGRGPVDYMLLCWFAAGWWIYELLKSKLPSYAIAAYPAIALMLGRYLLTEQLKKPARVWVVLYFMLQLVVGGLLIYGPGRFFPAENIWLFDVVAALNTVISLFVALSLWKGNLVTGIRFSAIQAVFFLLCGWGLLAPQMERSRSATWQIAQYIRCYYPAGEEVLFSEDFQLPSMPFYTIEAGFNCRMMTDDERNDHVSLPTHTVIIASDRYHTDYLKRHPGAPAWHIRGWVSDRGIYDDYYVIGAGK